MLLYAETRASRALIPHHGSPLACADFPVKVALRPCFVFRRTLALPPGYKTDPSLGTGYG